MTPAARRALESARRDLARVKAELDALPSASFGGWPAASWADAAARSCLKGMEQLGRALQAEPVEGRHADRSDR